MNTKKILCGLGMAFILMLALVPWLFSFVMSFKDYYAGISFANAPWIGFGNYVDFFDSGEEIKDLMSSSFIITAVGVITGAVYVFMSFMALGAIKKTALKAILAFVLMLPAVLPVNLYPFVRIQNFAETSEMFYILIAVCSGLKLSALFIPVGMFIRNMSLKTAFNYTLLFAVIGCAGTYITTTLPLYSVLDRDTSINYTFSNYCYYVGRVSGNYGYTTMLDIMQSMLLILPVIIGSLLLIFLAKKDNSQKSVTALSASYSAIGILPAALFVIMLVTYGAGQLFTEIVVKNLIIKTTITGVIISLASSVLVAVVSVCVAKIVYELKGVGIFFGCMLCALSVNFMGKFMTFIFMMRLYDNIIAVILDNLCIMPVIAMAVAMLLRDRECGFKGIIPAMITFLGVLFAWFWGNHQNSYLYIEKLAKAPVSRLVYNVLITPPEVNPETMTDIVKEYSYLPYILVPVLIAGVCTAVAVIVDSKKEKKAESITE